MMADAKLPAFCSISISRSHGAELKQPNWLQENVSSSKFLLCNNDHSFLVKDRNTESKELGSRLLWLSSDEVGGLLQRDVLNQSEVLVAILGQENAENPIHCLVAVFNKSLDLPLAEGLATKLGGTWKRLTRNMILAEEFIGDDLTILGIAHAKVVWHASAKFCGFCGSRTRSQEVGLKRKCINEGCGKSSYPRTDPSSIMTVSHGDDLLLGRGHGWPPGLWSCLAGFAEISESLEQTVVREVLEEAGVEVDPGSVQLVSTQPWPVNRGHSNVLMIGAHAEALDRRITMDKAEMDDVRWFSREEVGELLAASTISPELRGEGTLYVPGTFAIAHHLIQRWFHRQGVAVAGE